MIFDALVVGYVRANARRALVSIAAIALGVGTALTLWLAGSLTVRTLGSDRELFAQHADLTIAPIGATVPQDVLARVRDLDAVAHAEPIVERPVTLGVDGSGAGGEAAEVVGVDVLQALPGVGGFDEGRPGPFVPVGSFIDPGALIGTDGAIVSDASAARLHLRRGSTVAILEGTRIARLRVANVLPATVTGVGSNVAFVDFTTAQRLFGEPRAFDRIDVAVDGAPESARAAIERAVAGRARVTLPERAGTSLSDIGGGIDATFGALATIALLVGGLLVYGAVGTSIAQRRGEVGTLRALGVAPASIATAFVVEGAAYGAIGGLLGATLAEFAVQAEEGALGATQDAGRYDVWTFAIALAAGTAVAIVSSLGPALGAARIPPALAARQGAIEGARPERFGTIGATLAALALFGAGIVLAFHPDRAAWFAVGFPTCFSVAASVAMLPFARVLGRAARRATAGAPPAWRFAGTTLAAIPKRIAPALAALCVAVFAAVAFDVASTSFATSLHAWAVRGFAGDLLVRPAGAGGTFDAEVVARVRATPGVRDVVAMRTVHALAGTAAVDVRGEDDARAVPHVALTPEPAMLGSRLATSLGAHQGDALSLQTPHGTLRVSVAEVRPDFGADRGAIVIARRVLRDAFDDDRIDALRVTLADRVDATTVETRIARRLAPLRLALVTTRELRDRFTGAFDGTFAFVRGLAIVVVAIASFGVASVLSALVFERRFDLVTLRRLGARRVTLVRMLAGEAFVVAVAGSALGLGLGIVFAQLQLGASDPVVLGFAIPLVVPVPSIAAILVAAIAASVAGPVLAARGAFAIATDRRA